MNNAEDQDDLIDLDAKIDLLDLMIDLQILKVIYKVDGKIDLLAMIDLLDAMIDVLHRCYDRCSR